ncbi:MAG: transketolase C-terminal domain-containing protein [Caldilineaceae bacterium]
MAVAHGGAGAGGGGDSRRKASAWRWWTRVRSSRWTVPSCSPVVKTERVLIVHEAVRTGGYGGELARSSPNRRAFDYLDRPSNGWRSADIPVPYNRDLGSRWCPRSTTS